MSTLCFIKYQGAGNDFILIDDRCGSFSSDSLLISKLCHRKFGIGADGVILLQKSSAADFRMRIYNSDGSEAASCGNGLRCLMCFLSDQGLSRQSYKIAIGDRIVQACFVGDQISINMGKALHIKQLWIDGIEVHSLDTGVPHVVVFSENLALMPFLRHHPIFQPMGTNVNLALMQRDGSVYVRTFERGVEAETLACGTGAAAVAFIVTLKYQFPNPIRVCSAGGEISIHVNGDDLMMIGNALRVFSGSIHLADLMCN